MIFLKIGIFVIAGVVFLVLVRRNAPGFALLCEIAILAVIVTAIIPQLESLLTLVERLQGFSTVSEEPMKIMFKVFGVLVVGAVVADICRDNGEGALAGVVDLGVKILAVTCALPVFTAVVEIALALLNR